MNPLARCQGMIVLAWLLAFAAVSVCGQTILTNADLTAFSNALTAGGTVTLDFDGTITVTNCLAITNSVVVDGSGHAVTISGGTNSEIFAVATNASLVLQDLTISDALNTNGSPGAITNDGVLSVYNCIFSNNISQPAINLYFINGDAHWVVNASGGAIINEGQLNVSNSIFIQNSAIGASGNSFAASSVPGFGGAIYNAGTAVIADCTFSGNSVIGGNGSVDSYGTTWGGSHAEGGAIFNNGTIVVTNSTFFHNQSIGGTGGEGEPGYFGTSGTGGRGGDGCGGAFYCAGGRAIVINSTFLSNSVVGGSGGTGGSGEDFGDPGPDFNGGTGGNGGNGVGGAICLSDTNLCFLTNVTLLANTSSAGQAGQGGAGVFVSSSSHGLNGANGTEGLAFGATVANLGGTFSALNTIFCVQSGSTNFYGPVTDLGYNLASDPSSSLTNTTSLSGVNPMLGTFGYYGGNTQTIPLLLGSPAINAGNPLAFPPVDQRGRPRPSGPAPDIGAFEYTFPTLGNLSVNETGAQLGLLGEVGDTYEIDFSSNLLDWTALTTNSLGATNAIEILDATTPTANRYYRARLK